MNELSNEAVEDVHYLVSVKVFSSIPVVEQSGKETSEIGTAKVEDHYSNHTAFFVLLVC